MKLFSFILSFFLLYMSFLPCGDMQECTSHQQHAVSASTEQQGHGHTDEACTPFCYCTCCAASVITQPVKALQFTRPVFSAEAYCTHTTLLLSDNLSSIWQPPRPNLPVFI